jgi:hypothetical protein
VRKGKGNEGVRVVRGAWCVVRGAWCVVRGAWCVVCGARVGRVGCGVRGAYTSGCNRHNCFVFP